MKIKGTTKVIQDLTEMQEDINTKLDGIDWDKSNADEKDEQLNMVWDAFEEAIDAIKSINDL